MEFTEDTRDDYFISSEEILQDVRNDTDLHGDFHHEKGFNPVVDCMGELRQKNQSHHF